MAGYPYATFESVQAAAYGMDIPEEAQGSVEALIAKAGERLARRVPRITQRVSEGSLSQDLVAGVVEDMVIRVLRNPHGFSSEQAGEFMYRIDRAVASGAIQVTAEDLELLGDWSPAFGNIRTRVPDWRIP